MMEAVALHASLCVLPWDPVRAPVWHILTYLVEERPRERRPKRALVQERLLSFEAEFDLAAEAAGLIRVGPVEADDLASSR